jgi:hypothetical protein
MNPNDELDRLWNGHGAEPFPLGWAGEEVGEVSLVLLDADVAACIQVFLGSGRRLDMPRQLILRRCRNELGMVVQHLPEPPRNYFRRLETMARLTLEELGRRQTPYGHGPRAGHLRAGGGRTLISPLTILGRSTRLSMSLALWLNC